LFTLVTLLFTCSTAPCFECNSASQNPPNFSKVERGLYRGGRPDARGVGLLASIGVKTIVSLEREWFEGEPEIVRKERGWASLNGIKLIHIPMHPFLRPATEEVRKALSVLTDSANHPVFVHCRKGSDRTGIVVAAFRIQQQGWLPESAYREMKRYGHRSCILLWWKGLLYEMEKDSPKSNTSK
jgi:tyrosine-protein phosphatase SIW14